MLNYSCKDNKVKELVKDFTEADLKADEADYLEARWKKSSMEYAFQRNDGRAEYSDRQTGGFQTYGEINS